MTDLFEDIKTKSHNPAPQTAETEKVPVPHTTFEPEAEVVSTTPKRGRGRPKKGTAKPVTKTSQRSHRGPSQSISNKVTYLSTETKGLLQKVKAMMLISTGQSLDESAIVALALDCFIEHHNLFIK